MKRGKIKAIIFDVGGVLQIEKTSEKFNSPNNHGVHEYVAKRLKLSLDDYFDAIDTAYTNSIEGKISKSETLSTISENLHVSRKKLERLFISAYRRKFRKNKELFRRAYELKQKDYDIAILSDQWHLSKEALIDKTQLRVFDAIVISCDVGIRKPDPRIYKLVLKQLHLKPGEVVFIDNREWNLVPARKLGMKTILYENNLQTFKDLLKLGVR